LVELPSFAVSPLPGKVVLDELLGLGVIWIQLLPGIGFVVDLPIGTLWEGQLLTTPDPNPRNAAVVILSKEIYRGEGILPHLIQALIHSCR